MTTRYMKLRELESGDVFILVRTGERLTFLGVTDKKYRFNCRGKFKTHTFNGQCKVKKINKEDK